MLPVLDRMTAPGPPATWHDGSRMAAFGREAEVPVIVLVYEFTAWFIGLVLSRAGGMPGR